jgi:hypothetical protein
MIASADGACDFERERAEPHTWWEIPLESGPCRPVGGDVDVVALQPGVELEAGEARERPRGPCGLGSAEIEDAQTVEAVEEVAPEAPGRHLEVRLRLVTPSSGGGATWPEQGRGGSRAEELLQELPLSTLIGLRQ